VKVSFVIKKVNKECFRRQRECRTS